MEELFENKDGEENMSLTEANGPINRIKEERAAGPDEIPIEILNLIAEEHIDFFEELLNKINDTGEIPN